MVKMMCDAELNEHERKQLQWRKLKSKKWKKNKNVNTRISGVWKMEERMKERKFMVMHESEHATWSVDSPR